jgi:hypothetical protein
MLYKIIILSNGMYFYNSITKFITSLLAFELTKKNQTLQYLLFVHLKLCRDEFCVSHSKLDNHDMREEEWIVN